MSLTLEEALKKARKKSKNRRGLKSSYYKLYINSKYWFEKRDTKKKEKPFCECCGEWTQCIHHETYHRLGKEKMNDLRGLCNICHQKIHFLYNEGNNSKKTLNYAFRKLRQDLNIYPYRKKEVIDA